MDMSTVTEWVETTNPDDFRATDAWLAGGTVLFSYGSEVVTRLLDITTADWTPISWDESGLNIAATCTVAEIYEFCGTDDLTTALPGLRIVRPACECFVASWKIWNTSTVGGNVATALPAGPMTSWLAGTGAEALIWGAGGATRVLPVIDLILGNGCTALQPGELIRSFHIPRATLQYAATLRRVSLTHRGRTAALVVARECEGETMQLTLTAATPRPITINLPTSSSPQQAAEALAATVTDSTHGWFDDPHGSPEWRRHMSVRLAEQAVTDLQDRGRDQLVHIPEIT